ncbi:MAG: hypothetical protein RM049_27745 [Nostoc sp. DedQUE04]|uniref:hypothetical protein n=1 Tax=Nostoc sp. DedQUE04 TaxID=3075390 RepID=UPI002AD4AD17|nr:hypothetical protein [Nostoc sp. DedQUE04]MDZ8139029.1 hypothetical protein [Nostoc sp. DedQUE04]
MVRTSRTSNGQARFPLRKNENRSQAQKLGRRDWDLNDAIASLFSSEDDERSH